MFDKIESKIFSVIDTILAILVAALVALTIVGVFSRYVFNAPIPWAEEVSLAIFAWFIFLGAGSAIRKKSVVSVDILYNEFSLKLKKISSTVTTVICVAAYIAIIILGFQLITKNATAATGYLRIPYKYLYFSIPFGSLFAMFALFCNLRDLIREKSNVKDFSEADIDTEALGFAEGETVSGKENK